MLWLWIEGDIQKVLEALKRCLARQEDVIVPEEMSENRRELSHQLKALNDHCRHSTVQTLFTSAEREQSLSEILKGLERVIAKGIEHDAPHATFPVKPSPKSLTVGIRVL